MTLRRTSAKDYRAAQEISEAHQERLKPFAFSLCNIAVGEQIEFWQNASKPSGIICTVVDDKHVEYNGDTWTLTGLAEFLFGKKPLQGPRYFKYKGEWLNALRVEVGK